AEQVARLLVAVDDWRIEEELRAGILHQRQLADREHVLRRDADALAGPFTTNLQTGLSRKHDDGAVGECAAETRVQGAEETVAVRKEHDDRDDAPRDAEHRQGRAEAMVIQAKGRFDDDLTQGLHHISNRSASTGGSSAALRAG